MTSLVHNSVPRGGRPRDRFLRDRMRWATGTPPGRLSALAAVLVALCLLAGLVGAIDVAQRRAALTEVTQRGIPLARAALDAYQALSEADATANRVFLLGDRAGPTERSGYFRNVREAAAALTDAATKAPSETAQTVALLSEQLTNYSALVEAAHTDNKRGFGFGAAYLRQASALARDTLLVKTHELYRNELTRIAAAQRAASSVPWLAIAFCVLVLAALVPVQLYLRETTRRTLNRGMLVATAAVLLSIGWLVATSLIAAGEVNTSQQGKTRTEALAEARITALTARSTEALARVERSNSDLYETKFKDAGDRLDGTGDVLGSLDMAAALFDERSAAKQSVAEATKSWDEWRKLHEQNRNTPKSANWDQAALLAAQVDERLAGPLADAQTTFQDGAVNAVTALRGADFAVVAWLLIAAVAACAGLAPRIGEYR